MRSQHSAALHAAGITRRLAQWRASRYSNVRYRIDARLAANLRNLHASISVDLTLRHACDIVLDWCAIGDASLGAILANGAPCPEARVANEHIVIPARLTRAGENSIALRVRTPIGVPGSALMRYRDRADRAEYVYTLCVPADARTLFPCFDQPDLKARFTLSLECPRGWRVVGNAAPRDVQRSSVQRQRVQFARTEPISTYLFAFAAGPFAALTEHSHPRGGRLYVRRSQRTQRAAAQTALRLNRLAVEYFAQYTGHRFPFAKYDLVLIPEFAFNGMEHAGATFLREESVLLPAYAPAVEIAKRANLIFHETAHQWFGNLLTMRWFDDVWIKEAFANWLAARAAAELLPRSHAWLAFAVLKASALQTDATRGSTALRQPLANLADAKSLYGNIIYGKGPALLRQLEHDIGAGVFRRGVRRLVAQHAYGSIDTPSLIAAFSAASKRDLSSWAGSWITRAGSPRVDTRLSERAGTVIVAQVESRRSQRPWPQRISLALLDRPRSMRGIDVRIGQSATRLKVAAPQLAGIAITAARAVIPNDGDFGYGIFVTDSRNLDALIRALPDLADPLRRWLIWSMAWEAVRTAARSPVAFIEAVLAQLPYEREPLLLGALLERLQLACRRYCSGAQQWALAERIETALLVAGFGRMARKDAGVRTSFLRTYIALARSNEALDRLHSWVVERSGGATLSFSDRLRCAQRLVTLDASLTAALLHALQKQAPRGDSRRLAFVLGAAERDGKRRYLEAFLEDESLPESWIEDALAPFNAIEHAAQTRPLLATALGALPRLKREHKIFFVNRWVAAFIGGQFQAQALAIVQSATSALTSDLRRKAREAADELECTVRIRARYARDQLPIAPTTQRPTAYIR